MIPALFLALAAGAILVAHLRKAPPPFQPGVFGRWFGGSPAPIEVIEPAPTTAAPRKRAPRKTTGG
jgi:hypothetical protein